jgi:uncharacterized protein YggE
MRTAVLAAAIVCLPALASAQGEGKIRIIGRATVEVPPDHVTVRVGVSTKAPTPTAALDRNSAIARKIIDYAKKFGVDVNEIQTDAVNLSETMKSVRDPDGSMRHVSDGYAAINTVRVKLSDLSRLGTFMREVLDQGATNIGGVQFGLSNPEPMMDETRQKAVQDARRQAEQLAAAAGTKLLRVKEINHPPRVEMRMADGAADMTVRRVPRMAVPVEAGTLQIGAEVEIIWALE